MIRITALNQVESDEAEPVKEVSKELLDQIPFQQYARALDLQTRGNLKDATQLYKDLLDSELLCGVTKPKFGKTSSQLWYLKYLCYKNLATISSNTGKLNEATEAYSAALELDDTDVALWHRFGQVYMQVKRFEIALYAFQRGVECNPRHWPCLDSYLTLLLALDYTEQCIVTIYEALRLDPSYLRGLVYRRHIYTVYKHMREYMEYLNPLYKWKEEDEATYDEERAKALLKEAEIISDAYVEQQEAEKHVCMVPNVTLKKPITRLTWESVGDSLVHMHHHMTEQGVSHASFIEIKFENTVEMEVRAEGDVLEKTSEAVTDMNKIESEIKSPEVNAQTNTTQKSTRRRSNELCSLKQWHWYTETLSTRGKTARKKKFKIYDTLRNLIKEIPYNVDIQKMMKLVTPNVSDKQYFGTESEQKDVKAFIKKYIEIRKDIIDLLSDYLSILACKCKTKWSAGLAKTFIEANICYSTHIDIPVVVNNNNGDLLQYIRVNLLAEELLIHDKLIMELAEQVLHNLSVIDSIEMILTVNPHLFPSNEYPDLIQRVLRLKVLVHIFNGNKDLAFECLYQFYYEVVDV